MRQRTGYISKMVDTTYEKQKQVLQEKKQERHEIELSYIEGELNEVAENDDFDEFRDDS